MTLPIRRALALLSLLAPALPAQQLVVPDQDPAVRRALEIVRTREAATIETQIALCEIPAPPFKEQRRAEALRDRFRALGLQRVRIDSVGNVIGERPGRADLPGVVISGHLDTVFPEGTDVTVKREGTMLRGPGIEDNCRGLAILTALVQALDEARVDTRAPLWFVGTVGEEGPGNLRGVRHLFERELKGKVAAFVSVDASDLNFVKDAVGSYRTTVTFSGPGGHSFGAFGMPNPMHALGRAIAAIAELRVAATPKTTFSVGIVSGGTTVNSIAASAAFQLDMRSTSPAALDALDRRFRAAVRGALRAEKARWPASTVPLTVAIDRWGNRPAGTQRTDSWIVRATSASARALGFDPPAEAASTDANLPISLGIPSVTIGGGGKASGGHSLAEAWDSADSHLGTQWALLLGVTLAGRP